MMPAEIKKLPQSSWYGHFGLTKKLGAGGMGEVWKAWDTALNRWVAIKILKVDDETERLRLQHEAKAVAKLNHPNIVQVYEVHDGFIVMQLIHGVTLDKLPTKNTKLVVGMIRDAADAVHAAHTQGVIHRDLKPGNLMWDGQRVYLMDFGLAKQEKVKSALSTTGMIVGTPSFMSPEQAAGAKVGRASDIYSLGAALYTLLAGRAPFKGLTVFDTMRQVIETEPMSLRQLVVKVDADLDLIVMKCLEKDQTQRYRSAGALADDLDRWLNGEAVTARPPSFAYQAKRWLRKYGLAVIPVAAGVLIAAGLLVRSDMARRRAEADKAAIEKAEMQKELTRLRDVELLVKAEAAHRAGDSTAAMALVDQVLSRDPNLEGALAMKGGLLGQAGKPEEGLSYLMRAYGLNKSVSMARNIGVTSHSLGRHDEVVKWLRPVWRDNNPQTGFIFIDSLIATRQLDEAESAAKVMLVRWPHLRDTLGTFLRTIEAARKAPK